MTSDHGAPSLLSIAMQIPDLSLSLAEALADHGSSVEEACDVPGLQDAWTNAEPESRACVLMSLAWSSREHGIYPGQVSDGADDPAYQVAEELHRYALQAGSSEEFHGPRFPAMPLPGPAGALASSIGFDREEEELYTSLRTALVLMAQARPEPKR